MSEINPGEDKGLPDERTNPIAEEQDPPANSRTRSRDSESAHVRDTNDEIEKLDPVADEANPLVETQVGRVDQAPDEGKPSGYEGGDRVQPGPETNVA